MTEITNPEFEAKHARGQGGRFVSVPKEETPVEMSPEKWDQFTDVLNKYWDENYGTDPDPDVEEDMQERRDSMTTRMTPVDSNYYGGIYDLGGSTQRVHLVDNDGKEYATQVTTQVRVEHDGKSYTYKEWHEEGPAFAAGGLYSQLEPDTTDDDEIEEFDADPDRFTIKKFDENKDRLEAYYGKERFDERKALHKEVMEDDPYNDHERYAWEDYRLRAEYWPTMKAKVEQRRKALETAEFKADVRTTLWGEKPGDSKQQRKTLTVDKHTASGSTFDEVDQQASAYRHNAFRLTKPEEFKDQLAADE